MLTAYSVVFETNRVMCYCPFVVAPRPAMSTCPPPSPSVTLIGFSWSSLAKQLAHFPRFLESAVDQWIRASGVKSNSFLHLEFELESRWEQNICVNSGLGLLVGRLVTCTRLGCGSRRVYTYRFFLHQVPPSRT